MSKTVELCSPYVWEDPRYLFQPFWKLNVYDSPCYTDIVNFIITIYLFAIVIGLVINFFTDMNGFPILFFILATFYLYPFFQRIRTKQVFRSSLVNDSSGNSVKENFNNPNPTSNSATTPIGIDLTDPLQRNPFQNITIDQYKYEPNRPAAADITKTQAKIALDEQFRVQWYSDPTDVFGKTQSQRMFITQPVTTIPNDQGSYQDWLYKIPGKTCKEGNPENCYSGTAGAAIPWLNM